MLLLGSDVHAQSFLILFTEVKKPGDDGETVWKKNWK